MFNSGFYFRTMEEAIQSHTLENEKGLKNT